MAKVHKLGMYGNKTRKLQYRLSYERTTQTHITGNVWLYLGSRTSDTPALTDVQNKTFMEVPDRAYAAEPVEINLYFEAMQETNVDLSRYGVVNPLGDEQIMRIHVDSYQCLGRPPRSGDIIEIPRFAEDCGGRKAIWEVTDVDRSQETEKFYSVVYASPMTDSRNTREIPKSKSNENELDFIFDEMQEEFDATIPYAGVDTDGLDVIDPTENKGEDNDVRTNDVQKSFLDDPTKLL